MVSLSPDPLPLTPLPGTLLFVWRPEQVCNLFDSLMQGYPFGEFMLQLRALRDYARKNGYLVAREYVDEAESGRIADRPEFRKMIDAASKTNAPFREILIRQTQ